MKDFTKAAIGLYCAVFLAAAPAICQDTTTSRPEAKKEVIPDTAAQSKEMKLVEDVYKKEIAAAKDARAKVLLANKLITAAADSQGDRAGAFVLLSKAMDLSASGGDIETTFSVVDELSARWEIDLPATAERALIALARSGATPGDLAARAQGWVAEAISAERYDVARKIADIGVAAAKESHDPKLMKSAQRIAAEIGPAMAAGQRAHKALTLLETNPQDPAANLEAGKYRCFVKGDWVNGLQNLAKGSDSALAALASKDLAGSDAAQDQLDIADRWWDFSQKEQELLRRNILGRAGHWYGIAVLGVTGLVKLKAQQRLDEIGARDTAAAGDWVDLVMPGNAGRVAKSGDVADTPEGIRLGPASASALATAVELTPPFKVEFLANLDTTHLHIGYGKGYIILNQEGGSGDLRFADPVSGAEKHFPDAGKIQTGRFVRIGLVVTGKSAEVFVEGKPRGQITGAYTKCKSKLSIESRFGAVVIVKSFRVQGLQ